VAETRTVEPGPGGNVPAPRSGGSAYRSYVETPAICSAARGPTTARYLAFHTPRGIPGRGETVEDLARDQIEYTDEDPVVRQTFESELSKRGLTSLMPDQAYKDHTYKWDYAE
jgi:hypothetical protein